MLAIALATLLLGVVVGFFIGRAADDATESATASTPLTSPSTAPTSRPPGDTIAPNPTSPTSPTESTLPQVDIAPSTVGSIDDPIPLGQTYVLGLFEITVLDADHDATATLGAANAPSAGSDHLLVEIRIRFTDNGVARAGSVPFFVTDGTTKWTDLDNTCGAFPESLLDTPPIQRDEDAVGNACFTVPSDVLDAVVLGTDGFSGDVYFSLG